MKRSLFKKFEGSEIGNLMSCKGGTVYMTCGEVSANCEDEAGSYIGGKYDDIYDSDFDCNDFQDGSVPLVLGRMRSKVNV